MDEEKEAPIGGVAGAGLGLLAFILAFTFGIVSDRYDSRKELVREDAIAVRTAHKRAEFLPETERREARSLLREYLDRRIAFAQGGSLSPERVAEFVYQDRDEHAGGEQGEAPRAERGEDAVAEEKGAEPEQPAHPAREPE